MKYPWVIAFLVPLAVIAAGPTSSPDAQEVLRHISHAGPQQALLDYYDKRPWPAITRGIASGNAAWLKVYLALKPASDGGAGEDLDAAIFDALPVQPFQVLSILMADGRTSAEEVCTFTFEANDPAGGIDADLDRLERALAKADTDQQRALAESCRRGVEATRSNFRRTA